MQSLWVLTSRYVSEVAAPIVLRVYRTEEAGRNDRAMLIDAGVNYAGRVIEIHETAIGDL